MNKTITLQKKNKNWVLIDLDQEIKLAPEIIIKYKLKTGDIMNLKTWENMIDENSYYVALFHAYSILKRRKTSFELKEALQKQSFKDKIIKQVINKATEQRFIDDFAYAKDYIEEKKYQYGPKMLIQKLEQKGISKNIINSHLKDNEIEILNISVPKFLNKKTNKTKNQLINSTKQYFYAKGFSLEPIEQVLVREINKITIDTDQLLKKEYNKISKKLVHIEDKYEFKNKVIQKLLLKGFSYDEIKKYIEEVNANDFMA